VIAFRQVLPAAALRRRRVYSHRAARGAGQPSPFPCKKVQDLSERVRVTLFD
jgi:hypothetical protein